MKRSRLAFTLAALLIIACSGDEIVGPHRVSGSLSLGITVLHEADGALLVMVRGGAVDSVTSPELGLALLETGAGQYSVLLRGRLHEGVVVRLWVPDRTVTYTATIEQATEGYRRTDPGGYAASVQTGR
jgi:hypothetical protein